MHQFSDQNDTIAAVSSAPGEGAIALIRLSGDEAVSTTNQFFSRDLAKASANQALFGQFSDGTRLIDEAVVTVFKAPKSYTAEDVVEISCHGSTYIIESLLKLFLRAGARLAKPGEFTMRAFLNGKMDLSQAEAVADLIASDSQAAHEIAMKQMKGGFSHELQSLREQLIHFASMIELELDFSEEDVEFADRNDLLELIDGINAVVTRLIRSFDYGNAIKHGVATVIVGRPNAGKSTLLNALLNEERAIVSDIPGTTRDTIEASLTIEGIRFRLTDTAGIREATDTIEKLGVERTFEKAKQAAILVFLFDLNDAKEHAAIFGGTDSGTAQSTAAALNADLNRLRAETDMPILIVGNKADLISREQLEQLSAQNGEMLLISSKEQSGIEQLKSAFKQLAIAHDAGSESVVISNIRHLEALQKVEESLEEVRNAVEAEFSGELVALDIRRTLHFLGEITGEVTTDNLLGNIFGKFCIGK